GRTPSRLNVSRFAAVPSSRYLAVAGPNERADSALLYWASSRGRAHSQRWVPRTAIAFTFLLPRTAPLPPRPAWRPSCEIVAYRTARSPAGPIAAIWKSEPSWALSADSVAPHVAPRRSPALSSRTRPSSTIRVDSSAARPTRTMASQLQRLPAMAKPLLASESLMRLVSGLLLTTANFADVVSGLPTSGLKTKASGASDASGSAVAPPSWSMSHAPRPAPPRY